ncbi:MAG TPA: alkaline phosphatase D family protein [Bacteroidia bacterium]|jgi:alkaline phosphatase D
MKKRFLFLFLLFSCIRSFAQDEVIYTWCGGVTSDSVSVNAKLTDTSSTIRLVLSTSAQFLSPVYSSFYSVDTNTNMMVAMRVGGLIPSTKYYYAVESGGVPDTSVDDVGSFTTYAAGAFSFSFVAGSCCLNSQHGVYSAMKNLDPLFYVNMGDLHYANPNSATNIYAHRDPYETLVLSKQRAAAFLKQVPIDYVWDDHDFCGNDSDSSYVGKQNARRAYREYVPHYPLPSPTGAIYQSYKVGRVRFIHTDLRSERYGSSMMGAQQKTWFKSECVKARNNNEMIAWISSVTWSGTTPDNWGGFQSERTELSNFFRDSMISNMFIICGDAHMLGIDDGSHGDFSSFITNGALYPVFAAGALNQNGSYKGGTFSEGGYFPNPSYLAGQFGLVNVIDTGGDDICIHFTGYRCDSAGSGISYVNYYEFCRTLGPNINSTPDVVSESSIDIFPNPSEGKFTLAMSGNGEGFDLQVMNALGEQVLGKKEAENNLVLDLSGKPPGVYFAKIISKRGCSVRKILVQH